MNLHKARYLSKQYHDIQRNLFRVIVKYMYFNKVPMRHIIHKNPLCTYLPFLLKNCGIRGSNWKKLYAKIFDRLQLIYIMRKIVYILYSSNDKMAQKHLVVINDYKSLIELQDNMPSTPELIEYQYSNPL